jgi:hypothetical protein
MGCVLVQFVAGLWILYASHFIHANSHLTGNGSFQEPQGIKGWRFYFSDDNLILLNALMFNDIL